MPTLFLCGDVMTGRGIDQILWRPSSPEIYEPYVRDARDYVDLAEQASGPIPRPADAAYIWGDALDELARTSPAARVINLETSITCSDDYWKGKGINYRMHPDHIACLMAARVDVCVLANNHVLDFGYAGLTETLETLQCAGIRSTGAGRTLDEARAPAVIDFEDGRLFIWSVGTASSGIPPVWAATPHRAGVDFLDDLSTRTADTLVERCRRVKRPGDIAVVSIHWGSNWGYDIPAAQIAFAHRLIDGGIDLIHGHSSHHPRPIEVYKNKLVLYGCGDFLNDYEGISGYEEYRGDLALMYFPTLDVATGRLVALRMTPMRVRRMRLERATAADASWLHERTNDVQASAEFACHVEFEADGTLHLRWRADDRQRQPNVTQASDVFRAE
jgi:poly-gamma-glutamate capsule biosynthesis protein CapA/YwtB (metallophosphatase superfamily)